MSPSDAGAVKPRWQRLASRVAGSVGVRYYTMLYGEKSLVGEIEQIEARLALDVRPATADEQAELIETLRPVERRLAGRAVEQGGECLIAWHEDEATGYSWINREVITLVGGVLIGLPPEGAYTFNSFVWPAYRKQKIFQALTGAVYTRLKSEGYRFCCNMVDGNNDGSIGARAKYGVAYQPAPTLKLPGLRPRLVGRRFRMGTSL